jgi:hypothetical protein
LALRLKGFINFAQNVYLWVLYDSQRTSQHFMEPEGSLPCSQERSTSPYPESDQPNLGHPIISLYDPF